MFKVGDKVRIKSNIEEIVEERIRNHKGYIEAQWMIREYSGTNRVFTIKQVLNGYYLLDNNFYWGGYALEHADVYYLNRYSLLL